MDPTFDTSFYKILTALCERTCCDEVQSYVANKLL